MANSQVLSLISFLQIERCFHGTIKPLKIWTGFSPAVPTLKSFEKPPFGCWPSLYSKGFFNQVLLKQRSLHLINMWYFPMYFHQILGGQES